MGSCKSSCPSGYFVNESNSAIPFCQTCSADCLKCVTSSTYCTSCNATMYLKNNTCVSNCGDGYYLDMTIYACFICVSPCNTCSAVSTCTSCQNSSYILYFGQCLTSCPDGTYSANSSCFSCPNSCLTCYLNSSINSTNALCNKCIVGLYMSSTETGVCLSACATSEYGDIITRNCYSCISPCLSCSSAIGCLSCNAYYLLYQNQCLFISRCPTNSYLLNQTCLANCSSLWADSASAACIAACSPPSLKVIENSYKFCVPTCPSNYYVDVNYICQLCLGSVCDNLLSISIDIKSIFNVLYAKMTFSQVLNLNVLNESMMTVAISSRSIRLLSESSIDFTISSINLNAVWLQLTVN